MWAKVFQLKAFANTRKRNIRKLKPYIAAQDQFEGKLDKCIALLPDKTRTTNPWEWSIEDFTFDWNSKIRYKKIENFT